MLQLESKPEVVYGFVSALRCNEPTQPLLQFSVPLNTL